MYNLIFQLFYYSLHDVQMYRVIYLRYGYKTLLLGDFGCVFVGYPAQVGRIDFQDFVQIVSAIPSERYDIVSVALHPLLIVFHDQQATPGKEKQRACHPQ